MPLYEYRCDDCRRKFTLLVGVVAGETKNECPRCGSAGVRKLISRFAVARNEDDLLDDITDPTTLGDPEDPRAIADWMRRVGREMGEDMGDDFDELVDEAVREESDGVGDEADGTDDSGVAGDE